MARKKKRNKQKEKEKTGEQVVYQIKVTLAGSDPPIWRRIQVTGDTTLATLHRVLQIVMGWEDYHLHDFEIRGARFGDPEFLSVGLSAPPLDEADTRLSELVLTPKTEFTYEYDFGDSWIHQLLVEEVLERRDDVHYPRCVAGEKAAPPEDVGGIWGYYEYLEILADPEHEEHEDYVEWRGEDFDADAFDLAQINDALSWLWER